MPRPPRANVDGEICHALSYGNGRMNLLHTDAGYESIGRIQSSGDLAWIE